MNDRERQLPYDLAAGPVEEADALFAGEHQGVWIGGEGDTPWATHRRDRLDELTRPVPTMQLTAIDIHPGEVAGAVVP